MRNLGKFSFSIMHKKFSWKTIFWNVSLSQMHLSNQQPSGIFHENSIPWHLDWLENWKAKESAFENDLEWNFVNLFCCLIIWQTRIVCHCFRERVDRARKYQVFVSAVMRQVDTVWLDTESRRQRDCTTTSLSCRGFHPSRSKKKTPLRTQLFQNFASN